MKYTKSKLLCQIQKPKEALWVISFSISIQLKTMCSFVATCKEGRCFSVYVYTVQLTAPLQVFPSLCEPVSNTTAAPASAAHNQSICSITDNIFFTMSGFDAAQMNYVSIIV